MTKEATEQGSFTAKDYHDPPPEPLFKVSELGKWSFYRALIAEYIATLLFLYITVLTVIGYKSQINPELNGVQCCGVGILGIAWAFGGMIFVLVYCTAGISGCASKQSYNYRLPRMKLISILTLFLLINMSSQIKAKLHIKIVNNMENKATIQVHCKSDGGDEKGTHDLPYGTSYKFGYRFSPIFYQVYRCEVSDDLMSLLFQADFKFKDNWCVWYVKRAGIYYYDGKKLYFKFQWSPKE